MGALRTLLLRRWRPGRGTVVGLMTVGLMTVGLMRPTPLLQVLVQMLFQVALDSVVDQLVQLPAAAALASPHGITRPFTAWAPRHQGQHRQEHRPAATARSPRRAPS